MFVADLGCSWDFDDCIGKWNVVVAEKRERGPLDLDYDYDNEFYHYHSPSQRCPDATTTTTTTTKTTLHRVPPFEIRNKTSFR